MDNARPNLSFTRPAQDYCRLVHNLPGRLPPPLAATPEALLVRNDGTIAQVAALMPADANEAALATQCVALRAQADEMLRLLRQHAGDDVTMVMKLNAQYVAMIRASLDAHGHLLRVQALRHKRESSGTALEADARTQRIATRS
jgi:hypothetical protein